jgi:NitT/TauT family transport system ATP-binding protein
MQTDLPVIRFAGISQRFLHRGASVLGLENVTFSVAAGEVVAIVGPSGCGKTTLLRLAAGLLRPTSGDIYENEMPLTPATRPAGYVGFIPQHAALLPHRTVYNNVAITLEIQQAVKPARVNEILELVGLRDAAELYPAQLSGGMLQRVALARALVYHPSLLLADEPFSAVDELLREELQEQLVRVQKALKQSLLFVTHSIEEAVFIADRVLIMSPAPGNIKAEVAVTLPARTGAIRSMPEFLDAVIQVRSLLRYA